LKGDPVPDSKFEWFSLLQHHGGPTRFLDFTNSPWIAVFFAIQKDLESDGVIWAIRRREINSETASDILKDSKLDKLQEVIQVPEIDVSDADAVVCEYMLKHNTGGAFIIEPPRANRRSVAQRSCFLIPGTVTLPLVDVLDALYSRSSFRLVKVIIARHLKVDFRTLLFEMNIGERSLFPDLDGLTSQYRVAIEQFYLDATPPSPASTATHQSQT